MDFLSDILLAAGAFGAAIYCHVLSRRLRRFTALESGMGGAIAVLSAQVDDMTRAVAAAKAAAGGSARQLQGLTDRAEGVAMRLELLVASMHDLPEGAPATATDAQVGEGAGRRIRLARRAARPGTEAVAGLAG